jgi:hypothetical protein
VVAEMMIFLCAVRRKKGLLLRASSHDSCAGMVLPGLSLRSIVVISRC